MSHTVDLSEIEGYTFEQIIYSDVKTGKRLVVFVNPIDTHMHFKLYIGKEVMGLYTSLEVAILDYNKIK